MTSSEFTRELCIRNADSKIFMLVIDGLGGLSSVSNGKSELEMADLPNLDALAASGSCGLLSPLGGGFTPGSGPAHLALFGYDPWVSQIGRGALSALGLGIDFQKGDVAARLNFCTIDDSGKVIDRRAGRISTEVGRELCRLLRKVSIPGVKVSIAAEAEYRAGVVFHGEGLSDHVCDSDPQRTNVPPAELLASNPDSERMVEVAMNFLNQARDILCDQEPANMVLMRGFGRYPELAQFEEVYGLKALGIAGYPMYRGVSRAVGMETIDVSSDLESECRLYENYGSNYDFVYMHYKKTDSAGEDGDFDRKVKLLEELDSYIPRLLKQEPDVFIVTGDHSTPSVMRSHSWHPVPLILNSKTAQVDAAENFTELECRQGVFGIIPSATLMSLALANAGRLNKFGA